MKNNRVADEFAELRKRVEQQNEWARQYRLANPAPKPINPKKLLAQQELTRQLRKAGVTVKQLDSVRFQYDEGYRFRTWRVCYDSWPAQLLNQLKPWCTLRWLILDNPPGSDDKSDAWEWLSTYLAHPIFEAGVKQRKNLAAGRPKANKNREIEADDKALAAFQNWQRAARGALMVNGQSMSAEERVEKYLIARSPVPRRHRECIQRLLRQGKIPAL